MSETPSNRNIGRKYRFVLIFVIALTAFSSAVREWRQVVTITQEVGEFISVVTNAVVPTAHARSPLRVLINEQQTSDEVRWSGTLQAGKSIEVKGINGDISAVASSGNQVEVIATKRSRRGDVGTVQIKVVEHDRGVTICALYPTEDGSYGSCGSSDSLKGPRTNNPRNDVKVDFEVRVPAGINLEARTVNGDISVKSLMSNVVSRSVNGSIDISTSGYADAATVNGSIMAKLGNSNWTGLLNFTTVNGAISIDMPADVNADVEAQTLNGKIVSDFQLNAETSKSPKQLRGKIGSGGRELLLKTVNGGINLKMS
jgi:hypothetical protein